MQANVTIEELERFRQQLLVFNEESLSSLQTVHSEVSKRRHFLEYELPAKLRHELTHWENKLEQANHEITSSSKVAQVAAMQCKRLALNKIAELEERLLMVKKWRQQLGQLLAEPEARLLKLKTFLINDMAKASAHLNEQQHILDEYTRIQGDPQA